MFLLYLLLYKCSIHFQVCMAFKILTSSELPIDNLKAVVSQHNGFPNDVCNDPSFDNFRVDFNQFCCIMTEFRNQVLSINY